MAEITAYPRASPDFPRGQRANCSLVTLQQTMGSQFPCSLFVRVILFQLHFYSTLVPSGDAQIADFSADASLEEGATPMSTGGAFDVGGRPEDVVRVLRTYGPYGQTVPAKTTAKVRGAPSRLMPVARASIGRNTLQPSQWPTRLLLGLFVS